MKILPSVASSRPPIMRSVVVLPQPDGPSMATNSPCRNSAVKSMTARAPPGNVFDTCSRTTSNSLMPGRLPSRLRHGVDHGPHRIERNAVERALLIELGQDPDRPAQVLVVARVLLELRQRLGERHLARFLGAQVLLHQRIEVIVGLLERSAIGWPAAQARNTIGAQPSAQPLGQRLRQGFDHLADAEALRE